MKDTTIPDSDIHQSICVQTKSDFSLQFELSLSHSSVHSHRKPIASQIPMATHEELIRNRTKYIDVHIQFVFLPLCFSFNRKSIHIPMPLLFTREIYIGFAIEQTGIFEHVVIVAHRCVHTQTDKENEKKCPLKMSIF